VTAPKHFRFTPMADIGRHRIDVRVFANNQYQFGSKSGQNAFGKFH
jgi:hypothetical protein